MISFKALKRFSTLKTVSTTLTILSHNRLFKVDQVKNVGVLGAGQMGTGIGIVMAANAKKNVKLIDRDEQSLSKSRKFVETFLEKEVTKNKITSDDRYKILERFSYSLNVQDLHDHQFICEAVVENFEAKKKLYTELDNVVNKEAIFASNTSSISITKLAATTKRPGQFIGMHWMNPVPVMKLVEIIRGLQTSDDTLTLTRR